jgi:hypothetical protein
MTEAIESGGAIKFSDRAGFWALDWLFCESSATGFYEFKRNKRAFASRFTMIPLVFSETRGQIEPTTAVLQRGIQWKSPISTLWREPCTKIRERRVRRYGL